MLELDTELCDEAELAEDCDIDDRLLSEETLDSLVVDRDDSVLWEDCELIDDVLLRLEAELAEDSLL